MDEVELVWCLVCGTVEFDTARLLCMKHGPEACCPDCGACLHAEHEEAK